MRRGGLILILYEHSLTITLLAIFAGSFALHALAGAGDYGAEQLAHGGQAESALAYLGNSRFRFESLHGGDQSPGTRCRGVAVGDLLSRHRSHNPHARVRSGRSTAVAPETVLGGIQTQLV